MSHHPTESAHVAREAWSVPYSPRCFLEGDPDRPLITGTVYNASAMPPYALPDNATKSTVKSNSSKGGNGFNEIRFEDKAGSEELYVRAQKDMTIEVVKDRRETVKQGNYGMTVSTGSASIRAQQEITIESDTLITLRVGANSLVIAPTGISIAAATFSAPPSQAASGGTSPGTHVAPGGGPTADPAKTPDMPVESHSQAGAQGPSPAAHSSLPSEKAREPASLAHTSSSSHPGAASKTTHRGTV